jgi:hypothetical protein
MVTANDLSGKDDRAHAGTDDDRGSAHAWRRAITAGPGRCRPHEVRCGEGGEADDHTAHDRSDDGAAVIARRKKKERSAVM